MSAEGSRMSTPADTASAPAAPTTLDALAALLPEHAKDLKLNLRLLAAPQRLSAQQAWGTALASALAAGRRDTLRAIEAEARARLSPEALRAAHVAASLMAMNNVYYRFVHLAGQPEYGQLPAGLRMQALGNHGVPAADFELWALAVSALNGCGACVQAHERKLREHGIAPEVVQEAVKLAAVVQAVALTLENRRLLEGAV
jgi:lipoyl-dependent peroxiredoxin subunit D